MIDLRSDTSVRIPLRLDATGAIRVGETRVSLPSVLIAFQQGETPEQIVHSFPTLDLSEVYAVITYYLANRAEVDAWLDLETAEGKRIQREAEARFDHKGLPRTTP